MVYWAYDIGEWEGDVKDDLYFLYTDHLVRGTLAVQIYAWGAAGRDAVAARPGTGR